MTDTDRAREIAHEYCQDACLLAWRHQGTPHVNACNTLTAAIRQYADERAAAEREACAKVADEYAAQNSKGASKASRRANILGDDPFGHGEMAEMAHLELDACKREAEAIATAIRARGE